MHDLPALSAECAPQPAEEDKLYTRPGGGNHAGRAAEHGGTVVCETFVSSLPMFLQRQPLHQPG